MTARAIVRDPEILGGRWRFEGTSIAIASIRADFLATRAELDEQYYFAGLTDEDIEAALAFDFPEIRDVRIQMEYAAVTVSCTCGEDIHHAGAWPVVEVIDCLCARKWRVSIEPVREDAAGDQGSRQSHAQVGS